MFRKPLLIALIASVGFSAAVSGQDVVEGTDLYSVNLETGALTAVDEIGSGESVVGLALTASGGTALALTNDNELFEFDVTSPDTIGDRVSVSGLESGENLIGIDVRPANGELWAVSNQSRLYSIDVASGTAVSIGGVFDPALEGVNVGFDFNPTVDRIRVVVSTTQNLRLNPETGLIGSNPDTEMPTVDGNLAFAEGDANAGTDPVVVGAGYTNSVDGAEATELYVLDAATQSLALQNPPNDGTLNTVGPLGVEISVLASFDIGASGESYVANPTLTELPETGSGPLESSNEAVIWTLSGGVLVAVAAAVVLRPSGQSRQA